MKNNTAAPRVQNPPTIFWWNFRKDLKDLYLEKGIQNIDNILIASSLLETSEKIANHSEQPSQYRIKGVQDNASFSQVRKAYPGQKPFVALPLLKL